MGQHIVVYMRLVGQLSTSDEKSLSSSFSHTNTDHLAPQHHISNWSASTSLSMMASGYSWVCILSQFLIWATIALEPYTVQYGFTVLGNFITHSCCCSLIVKERSYTDTHTETRLSTVTLAHALRVKWNLAEEDSAMNRRTGRSWHDLVTGHGFMWTLKLSIQSCSTNGEARSTTTEDFIDPCWNQLN